MTRNGFVSIIDNDGNYKVAIGYCGTWEETQFLVIEYTDLGEIVYYYDNNNLSKLKEVFNQFHKTEICTKNFRLFEGNDKLQNLLDNYKKESAIIIHSIGCKCQACSIFSPTIYINDTFKWVIEHFSNNK